MAGLGLGLQIVEVGASVVNLAGFHNLTRPRPKWWSMMAHVESTPNLARFRVRI